MHMLVEHSELKEGRWHHFRAELDRRLDLRFSGRIFVIRSILRRPNRVQRISRRWVVQCWRSLVLLVSLRRCDSVQHCPEERVRLGNFRKQEHNPGRSGGAHMQAEGGQALGEGRHSRLLLVRDERFEHQVEPQGRLLPHQEVALLQSLVQGTVEAIPQAHHIWRVLGALQQLLVAIFRVFVGTAAGQGEQQVQRSDRSPRRSHVRHSKEGVGVLLHVLKVFPLGIHAVRLRPRNAREKSSEQPISHVLRGVELLVALLLL
mmetsp:Transcript_11029/g.41176  ORF Transcript_11029/g.41176 Transcript_11029/m.41176 type:complete len:261 (-) Transcript_11029:396-1178(-)